MRRPLRQILPSLVLAAHVALLPWFATLHAAGHTERAPGVGAATDECIDAALPAHRGHLDGARVHVSLDCDVCLFFHSLQKRQGLSTGTVTPAPLLPAVRADTATVYVRTRVTSARPMNKSPPLLS